MVLKMNTVFENTNDAIVVLPDKLHKTTCLTNKEAELEKPPTKTVGTTISEFLQADQTENHIQSKSAQNSTKILISNEIKSISKKSKMKEEKGKPRIFVDQTRTDQNFRTSRPARCKNVTCEQHWLLEEARNQTFISTGNGTKCVKCQNNAQYFHGYKEIKQEIKEIWRSRSWFQPK
jgi:hypothetical protein